MHLMSKSKNPMPEKIFLFLLLWQPCYLSRVAMSNMAHRLALAPEGLVVNSSVLLPSLWLLLYLSISPN